jgi:Ribosomal protein L6
MEIKADGEKKLKFVVYHGNRKHVACIRTVRSIVNNMVTGVTKGFQYKMRYVYAHFPINVIINDGGKEVEIRNFLGQKVTFRVKMLEGCSVESSSAQKDELIITGNDLDAVSQSGKLKFDISLIRSWNSVLNFMSSFQLPASNKPPLLRTRISVSSWTVSTFPSATFLRKLKEQECPIVILNKKIDILQSCNARFHMGSFRSLFGVEYYLDS